MTPDNKVNILVVDDLFANRVRMQQLLADLGETVTVATSGQEALQQVLHHDFAVILLDADMPGMNGYETAVLIHARSRSAHTPILFITGHADALQQTQGYSLGTVDYILSPVNPELLHTKVRGFVELFRMSAQAKGHTDERVSLQQELTARMAAESAHRQAAFVAEISATLATLLDPEATARGITRLSMPFLADLSAVTLASDRGGSSRTELAWSSSPDSEVTATHLDTEALPGPFLEAVRSVLRTGQMVRSEDLGVAASSAESGWGQAGPPFALGAALIIPLRARNQVLGSLSLVLAQSDRRFGPAELMLAADLANRAAIFLDNARLHRAIAESVARKNEFLAMLAHELRNPLAAIRGAVHVLCLSDLGKDKVAWARAIIDRQVNQLVRLVDDLLDVARITQGKIRLQAEPVDVTAVVELAKELSGPLLEARHHQLTVSCPKGPLWVRGDSARLAQVLANLLNNAAKYTDAGGQITLAVEREPEHVLVQVRDNGIGIPGEMVGIVFDLFTQASRTLDRSQGGLGIGLTLVRHIVEMHGGSVSAKSAGLNQGSVFTVRLPLLPAHQAPQPPAEAVPAAGNSQSRVLVVDDNRDVADSLAIMLKQQGHEVCLAHDGPAAILSARTFRPQVVLLDIGLPGLDGYEVARRLRGMPELAGTFLVAVTGYGQSEARHTANQAGFDVHLVKPVNPQTLDELMARVPAAGNP